MDPVEEIKSRVSIEDVVGRVVDLKRSGSSLKGLCPFHGEKTPSFYVTPSRGSYHCFGCGRGGDVFSFVMELDRLTFPEALQRLADQAGVQLEERKRSGPSLTSQIAEANEEAAQLYQRALAAPFGERARRYLDSRGFDDEAGQLFGLGFAPDARDTVARHMRDKGIAPPILVSAGLARQDEQTGTLRDYFRNRLMFPIRDPRGRTIGFGARTLSDQQPKYLNSPQTELFDKSAVLFGIHLAGDAIRASGRAVVVEGYLDALRAHTCGFRDTVATLGTAVTAKHLTALARFAPRIVLALDPDPAGQTASARTALNALAEVTASRGREAGASATVELMVARLPVDGGDPDELIRDAPDRWSRAIESAVPAFEFFFEQILGSLDRSSDGWRQEAIDRLVPVIQQFATSTGWQAVWMERLAGETGIDPRMLQQALPRGRPSGRRGSPAPRPRVADQISGTTSRALAADPVILTEQTLLGLLVSILIVPEASAPSIASIPWQRADHAALASALLGWRSTGSYDIDMFLDTLPDPVRERGAEARDRKIPLPPDGQIDVALTLHVKRLERERVRAALRDAQTAVSESPPEERVDLTSSLMTLMTRLRELDTELDELSRRVIREGGAA